LLVFRLPLPTGIAEAELSISCPAHTGAVLHSTRVGCLALVVLGSLTLASCGGNKVIAREDQCREQVVLSLAPGVGRTDRVMGRLEDDANVKLEYVRSTSPTLFVYTLSTRLADPGCRTAMSRLRQDSHVRFVELDGRRTVRGFE
jgi:hypothetical protein